MRVQRRLLLWLGALVLVPALGMPAPAAAATGVRAVSGAPAPAPAPAQPPGAQGAGVQVDPNSPAGTEYQLPTDRAREQAGGGGGSTSASGSPGGAAREAPLFGTGVEDRTPPPTRRKFGANHSSGRSRGTDAPTTTAPTTTAAGAQPHLTPPTIRALAPAPDGGGGGMLTIGGAAAGVLLMGALAGLAWRRRTTGS